jgi:hypothetical protein
MFCLRFAQRHFAAQKTNAFLRGSPRQAARAVKAAVFAFIGAKRRALTEEASGLAQPLSRKALRRKSRLAEILRSKVEGC